MLFYLFSYDELHDLITSLGYPFEPDVLRNNIAYYVRRTSDGSTLSRVVHSWVLARGDRARSWSLFAEALESAVADIQGGTTRSEERRVGKACVSTCRSRWSPDYYKKKIKMS